MSSPTKTVYLIRHAESAENAGLAGADPLNLNTPLTKLGYNQTAKLADRLTAMDFDCIVSSPMTRAGETTDLIMERVSKPVAYSDLFVECRQPSAIANLTKANPIRATIEKEIAESFHQPDYRHSDEENFDELKTRAAKALGFLADRPEAAIIVVTHGMFMRILAAHAVFGRDLTAQECLLFTQMLRTANTGISILEYVPNSTLNSLWRLRSWNDHSHLS